jgi:hypothetical protein
VFELVYMLILLSSFGHLLILSSPHLLCIPYFILFQNTHSSKFNLGLISLMSVPSEYFLSRFLWIGSHFFEILSATDAVTIPLRMVATVTCHAGLVALPIS